MSPRFPRVALLAALALAGAVLLPTATFARALQFQASILDHQPGYLLVHTSANEALRFELGWFKNADGYALNRDEAYCFDVEQLPDGKLMLVSVQSCEEPAPRTQEKEDHPRDKQEPK